MNLEMITEGLKQLLQENNYSSATIRFMKVNGIRSSALRKSTEIPNMIWNGDLNISKNNMASLRNIIMERFPNRESNCSVLCICWKITVCIRCLPEDTMPQKSYYVECVLFKFIYGLFRLSEFYGTVSKYNRTL